MSLALLESSAAQAANVWLGQFGTGGAAHGTMIEPRRWVVDSTDGSLIDAFPMSGISGSYLSDYSPVASPVGDSYVMGKYVSPDDLLSDFLTYDLTNLVDDNGNPVSLTPGDDYNVQFYIKPTLFSVDGGLSTYYLLPDFAASPTFEYYTGTDSGAGNITLTGSYLPDQWTLVSMSITALPGGGDAIFATDFINGSAYTPVLVSGPGSPDLSNLNMGVLAAAIPNAVPEPASALMVGVAGLMVAFRRRK